MDGNRLFLRQSHPKYARSWIFIEYPIRSNKLLEETTDPEFSVDKAQELGKIQITIQRVKMVKRRVPFSQSTTPLETMNEIPEKALKGRPIETSVR